MSEVEQTQQLIIKKLEAAGKLGKMRAMVTEASLAAINADEDDMFTPSKKLKEIKATADGLAALALCHDFLVTLGLAYTAKVLEMESSLPAERLPTKVQLVGRFGGEAPSGMPLLFKVMADAEGAPLPAEKSSQQPKTIVGAAPFAAPVAASATPKPAAVPTPAAAHAAPATAATAAAAAVVPAAATPAGEKPDNDLYFISKFQNRELHRFNQVKGQQVQMEYLTKCKVLVLDPVDSITVDDCEDCEIVIAACEGSIFLRTCKNVVVTAACKQLRTRDCEHLDIRLFAGTDPVIESSHHITFRPYNLKAPKLIENFKAARLDPKTNRFPHVYDFTADVASIPQPHMELKYPDHGLKMVSVGEKFGAPECPPEIVDLLELRIEPAASSESGQNKSYNIKTGAKAWQQMANAGSEDNEAEEKPAAAPVGGGPSTKLPPVPASTATNGGAPPTIVTAAPAVAAAVPVPKPAPKAAAPKEEEEFSSFEDSGDDKSDKVDYSTDDDTF